MTSPIHIDENAIRLRNWSILILIIYLTIMILAFVYNLPSYILSFFTTDTTYSPVGKILLIILVLLGSCLILLNIFLYQHYAYSNNNNNKNAEMKSISNFNIAFVFTFIKIIASVLFIAFILWCIGSIIHKFNSSDIGSKIIDIFLIIGALAIVYKILSAFKLTEKPIVRILIHSLLYIPCLLISLVEVVSREMKLTTKPIILLIVIEIIIVILYFVYPKITSKIYTQGGKQIVNKPISLNVENSISTYQELNQTFEHTYQYALSFWFYIDSAPPSMNANYSKFANILSYGNNPSVKYNAVANTLSITVSHDEDVTISVVDLTHKLEDKITNATNEQITEIKEQITEVVDKVKHLPMITELDDAGRRIIYVNKNVLLQKWNNIILNYNGGTLDIFYNGQLVKSAIEVVPYLKYDTLVVGEQNGISGGIANVTYFREPLDVFKIKKLYNYMKNKNPPSL